MIFIRAIFSKKQTCFTSFFLCFSTASQSFQSLPNLSACVSALQSCAHKNLLREGQRLHSYMLVNGFLLSPVSTTSLINMYSKCNRISDALSVFDTSFHDHNVFGFNAIIAGLIANELPGLAFEFYLEMRVNIMPDKFTFPCVIKACSDLSEVFEGRKIHGLLFKLGLELDLFIGSALIHAYLKFELMEEAHGVFEELTERDVVLWNAMINGYAQIGEFDKVLEVFRRMADEGVVPNRFTVTGVLSVFAMKGDLDNGRSMHGFVVKMGYDSGVSVSNALIDMYGKSKCISEASEIFEMIDDKDIFSWNSIICIHEQSGDHDGTLKLFDRMLRAGARPDLVTLTTILPACAHLAALVHGREIHGYIITNGLGKDTGGRCPNYLHIHNAVLDMYAKCGSMREAQLVFEKMSYKDAASWNIMIMGYGMHGFGSEALNVFSRMRDEKLKPDEVTFVGVLSACSHAGLVSRGKMFLAQMEPQYGVVPTIEHYTCVIDMLGRAGQLDEAYQLLLSMPVKANSVVWRAFLAACQLHANSALAEVAAKKIFELEPEHCGSYVLMSNVYGAAGRYQEVSEVRHTMREQNVRKTPGCSWIELGNSVHVFVTGDRTHLEDSFICAALNSLTSRLQDFEHEADILNGAV